MTFDEISATAKRFMSRWVVRDVLLPFLVTRLMLLIVGWFALNLFRQEAKPGTWEIDQLGRQAAIGAHVGPGDYQFVNMWSRWDAGWYLSIARDGYEFTPGKPSRTAFFPLYPMLMRGTHALLGSTTHASILFAGILVSNLALLVAACYLFLLTRLEFDEATAARAVLYLMVFPMTLFFSAVYSESVFLAVVIASFYHARKGQWLLAGVFAALAALARSPGILILAPLALEYLMQRGFQWRKIRPDVLALGLAPVALGSYALYLGARFGNPRAIIDAQSAWGGDPKWPWEMVAHFFRGPITVHAGGSQSIIDFSFVLIFLLLVALTAVRLRPCYALYAIISYAFVTVWGSYASVPRYVMVIFPAFILLATLGRRAGFHNSYLAISSGLAAFFMAAFSLWVWIA
jgi:hypothetical protein